MSDWPRLILVGGGVLIGLLVFIFKPQLLASNADLSELIVTIFSVLAGFLMLTISMISASQHLKLKSILSQRQYKDVFSSRLLRYKLLFYAYLLIIFFVFYSRLVVHLWPTVGDIFSRLYLGLSAAALIWSLGLPSIVETIKLEELLDGEAQRNSRRKL